MKDEATGQIITKFVGLRSKMYCYIKESGENNKTANRIKKIVIKQDLKHEDYKNTLFNSEQMYHKMKTIRSNRHQPGSHERNKVSLSCFNDKGYTLKDSIQSCEKMMSPLLL